MGSPETGTNTRQRHSAALNIETFAELLAFQGTPKQFLVKLLATQCRLAKAAHAAIMRLADASNLETLAAYPDPNANGDFQQWIDEAEKPIRDVLKSGETAVLQQNPASGSDDKSRHYLVVVPVPNHGSVRAAAAFRIEASSRRQVTPHLSRLEMTPLLLNHHELRLTMEMQDESVRRLRQVLEMVEVVNRSKRFLSAAMALCNEIAARLGCGRVSLGFLDDRCVRVRAISHTDTFSRQMQVVQAIEAAMEECLDQDVEVIHPAGQPAMTVNRAAAKLATEHGPAGVLSMPIRDQGNAAAVMTLERSPEQPFEDQEEIATLRLICDLCAPRLLDLYRIDRWFGAQLAALVRKQAALLLGHQHTWMKVCAVLVFLAAAFVATAKGDYRIKASFAFEARSHQVVVAPFDSFTKTVLVEPGDRVEGGKTTLGTLETSELRLKLAELKAELLGHKKQMAAAMRDRQTAKAQMAQARGDKVRAQIRLIESQIDKAALVAPITGWVVSENLKQQIGAPVETGKILFEIAGIDSLRAELYVPESSITSVAAGQTGELATVGHPDQKVGFVIERIHPTAEVVNHQNVFKVRARILEQREWMRPGMEGQARIAAGKKSYLWIASHRVVNWLRMKLWL